MSILLQNAPVNIAVRMGLVFVSLFVVSCGPGAGDSQSRDLPTTAPPAQTGAAPGQGAVATGHYRNLFAELGYAEQAIRAKVDAAFQHLFYGNPESEAIYYPDGVNEHGEMAYIFDVNSNDVRSEGQSYGMMIAVQMDKKKEFDAIWNWSLAKMYHHSPEHPAHGYFAWSIKTNGEPNDEMPAPDGEEYIVTALYFASARWGNGEGIYNYAAWADRILTDMLHRQTITGPTNRGEMTAGNLFHPENAMVRFTPDTVNADHTDPSYHLPAFYEVWALVGPEKDRDFWVRAASVSREYFDKAAHPKTGLTPDYGEFDGSPWEAPWHKQSTHFLYDAWRTVMNWSMDYAWWKKDVNAPARSDRLLAFFESEGMDSYTHHYLVDGTRLGDSQPQGLAAMNATAGLSAADPRWKNFVEILWHQEPPVGQGRYFDGTLYLLAMLNCSGQYRVWLPGDAR